MSISVRVSAEEVVLEGQLSTTSNVIGGASGSGMNTLDEPIRETVLRDVKAVGRKFYHVLYPVERKSLLRDWDLWGPLILCTLMAAILQDDDDKASNPEFAEVFVIVWVGALVVTLNTKLLGGKISFFQSVCVLGYCLLPLTVALILARILFMVSSATSTAVFVIRCVSALVAFVWAVIAALKFLGDCQPERRRALAAYPMILFYFLIAWMVVSHSN